MHTYGNTMKFIAASLSCSAHHYYELFSNIIH